MTRYEQFLQSYQNDKKAFQDKLRSSGVYEFGDSVKLLLCFQNQLNGEKLLYLFGGSDSGDRLYEHLAEKFVKTKRNLLEFFNQVDNEIMFFILYELRTNPDLIRR